MELVCRISNGHDPVQAKHFSVPLIAMQELTMALNLSHLIQLDLKGVYMLWIVTNVFLHIVSKF